MEIDEIGSNRLKGKEETDHNTIITEIEMNIKKEIKTEMIYNTKNKRKWETFNKELTRRYELNEPQNYTEFENMIVETMSKCLDKITIKKGQYKPKITEKAKRLKTEKKWPGKSLKRPKSKIKNLN